MKAISPATTKMILKTVRDSSTSQAWKCMYQYFTIMQVLLIWIRTFKGPDSRSKIMCSVWKQKYLINCHSLYLECRRISYRFVVVHNVYLLYIVFFFCFFIYFWCFSLCSSLSIASLPLTFSYTRRSTSTLSTARPSRSGSCMRRRWKSVRSISPSQERWKQIYVMVTVIVKMSSLVPVNCVNWHYFKITKVDQSSTVLVLCYTCIGIHQYYSRYKGTRNNNKLSIKNMIKSPFQ